MKYSISGFLSVFIFLILLPSVVFSNDPKFTFKVSDGTDEAGEGEKSIDYYVDGKLVGNEKGLMAQMTRDLIGYVVKKSSGSIPDGVYKKPDGKYENYPDKENVEITIKDGKRVKVNDYYYNDPFTADYLDGQLKSVSNYPTYAGLGDKGFVSKCYYQGTKQIRFVTYDHPTYDVNGQWTGDEWTGCLTGEKTVLRYDSWEDADNGLDRATKDLFAFKPVVQKYRSLKKKPKLPAEARTFAVQAQDAMDQKQFDNAVSLYQQALEIAPWWPQGHYNRAELLGESNGYEEAIAEMKKYLLLEPHAKDAQAAQDEISKWEGRIGK